MDIAKIESILDKAEQDWHIKTQANECWPKEQPLSHSDYLRWIEGEIFEQLQQHRILVTKISGDPEEIKDTLRYIIVLTQLSLDLREASLRWEH